MLVDLMDQHGLTQIQLAKGLGVAPRTLQRWITDRRKPHPLLVMGVFEVVTRLLKRLKREKR